MNYYTPTPEKLVFLGFAPDPDAPHSGSRWVRRWERGNIQSVWTGVRSALADSLNLGAENGGEMLLDLDVRLRTEAEFDLLLWQIGWADKEPASAVVSRDFMLPG